MSPSNSLRFLLRPSTLEIMDMRRRIYQKFSPVHVSFSRMVMQDIFGDQRQFDTKPVSAIQHFI